MSRFATLRKIEQQIQSQTDAIDISKDQAWLDWQVDIKGEKTIGEYVIKRKEGSYHWYFTSPYGQPIPSPLQGLFTSLLVAEAALEKHLKEVKPSE